MKEDDDGWSFDCFDLYTALASDDWTMVSCLGALVSVDDEVDADFVTSRARKTMTTAAKASEKAMAPQTNPRTKPPGRLSTSL